jgi:hypothetical protein
MCWERFNEHLVSSWELQGAKSLVNGDRAYSPADPSPQLLVVSTADALIASTHSHANMLSCTGLHEMHFHEMGRQMVMGTSKGKPSQRRRFPTFTNRRFWPPLAAHHSSHHVRDQEGWRLKGHWIGRFVPSYFNRGQGKDRAEMFLFLAKNLHRWPRPDYDGKWQTGGQDMSTQPMRRLTKGLM